MAGAKITLFLANGDAKRLRAGEVSNWTEALFRGAVWLAVLLLAGSCGNKGGDSCTPRPTRGIHRDFIASLQGKGLTEKTALVLAKLEHLPAGRTSFQEANVRSLTDELLDNCEIATVESVERALRRQNDSRSREALERVYLSLSSASREVEAVQDLVAKLARELPDNVVLAPHRPGGEVHLLRTLENVSAPIEERLMSVWRLEEFGSSAVLPRLARFRNDRTPDEIPFGNPYGSAEEDTLGKHVRRAIETIERRSGR